ncbi:MAG: flagellar transcriptional regulator FlhD [Candidatus Thiodiazotropha sp. (ex Ctena orbiculata)]|uniref:Flagellar transcriptional regulator FlhD n=1 Tax=Candidatus Thiodiazotropha taylori TaxID=2792791 RepID=A0A944M7Y7_9GAMM|nr:flagellar transcriptional regulator FlhD [Candidatus Thiodiazotropha taylori]
MAGHIVRVVGSQVGKTASGGTLSSTFLLVLAANMRREELQQGEEEVKVDFSNINLEYLIHIRDIAREDPAVAAPLLGMSPELATLLAQAPSEYLAKISEVKVPLMAARGDAIWWYRLFKALVEENREEVEVVLQAASLAVLS